MADYDYEILDEGGEDDYYPDFYPDNEVLGDEDQSPWYNQDHFPELTLQQLFNRCIIPTLQDGGHHIFVALAWCIVYRMSTQFVTLPKSVCHIVSIFCGCMLMHHFFGSSVIYLMAQGIIAYLSLVFTFFVLKKHCGWICMALCLSFLIVCELFIVNLTQWHMIRAAQMLVAMRAISIGFQLDEKSLTNLPHPLPYFGYLYHVGTAAFGPWIPFKDYLNIDNNTHSVLVWSSHITLSVIYSLFSLSVSACWSMWLIPSGSSKWFMAYRDALSFRSSHYFVSYPSEATTLASGIDTSPTRNWVMTVTRPWNVELPRSLVEVVINWNLPMHAWLKNYVFRVAKPHGAFFALLGTYTVSALLHGLNFQLGAVLLSLGFYTYTEHVTRRKLSQVFSACIQARKCGANCDHSWKENNWMVKLSNLFMSLLAMFHLAYLGLMFDSSQLQEEGYSYYHVLAKWRWLNFSSHWITAATFLFYLLI